MYCNNQAMVFEGSDRTIWACVLMSIALLSIVLHVLFILAARFLCGWDSDFAFTLLIGMSCCSLVRFINEIVCGAIAFSYLDFCPHHHLFTFLGAIDLSCYLTLILLSVLMTTHRVIYTVFATKASRIFPPLYAKVLLALVSTFFIVIIGIVQQEDVHYHYVPSLLSCDDLAESTSRILRLVNSVTNYSIGVTHLVAYTIIFMYLFYRKSLSFSKNQELRMTMQVTVFVVIECVFFIYWEFFQVRPHTIPGLMSSAVIDLAFYDSIIIPYLLINRRVQKLVLYTIRCKGTSK